MVVLFCNKCFQLHVDAKNVEFYLSNCSHILCRQCVAANCPICKKPCKPTKISKHMPRAIIDFFDDPMKVHNRFQQVVRFQFAQQKIRLDHWRQHGSAELVKLQKKHAAMAKLSAKMDADIEKQRLHNGKLKTYLACHERRKEQSVKVAAPVPSSTNSRLQMPPLSQRYLTSTISELKRTKSVPYLNFDASTNFNFEL